MRWKAAILSAILAAALGLTLVPSASADPPLWAGRWSYGPERNYRQYDRQWGQQHEVWHRAHPYSSGRYWGGGYGYRDRDWYRQRDGDRWYGRRDYDRNGWYGRDWGNPW